MKKTIIDIGTNSVRMLIAEKKDGNEWETLDKRLNSTRLGEGMSDNAVILDSARKRTKTAVEEFIDISKKQNSENIFIYGTSIMRDAQNGKDFSDEIKKSTGIPVTVLSGKDEAYYSYIGASGNSSAVTAVVDVGGGSTEICVGLGAEVDCRYSFNLGCVRDSCAFDMTTARGIGELKKHCFSLSKSADSIASVKRWIAVGGTATSMASILLEMEIYDSEKIQGYILKQEDVQRLSKELSQMSYEERCALKGIPEERADIIVAGSVIIDSLMEYFALSEFIVSDKDLLEGLLEADILKHKENE